MKGRLRIECLNVDKYILAGTDLLIKLHPIDPKKAVITKPLDLSRYYIEIMQACKRCSWRASFY